MLKGLRILKPNINALKRDKSRPAPADAAQLFKDNQSVSEDAALAVDTIIPTPQKVKINSTDTPVSLAGGIKLEYQQDNPEQKSQVAGGGTFSCLGAESASGITVKFASQKKGMRAVIA